MNTIEEAQDNGLLAGTPEYPKDLTGEFVSQAKQLPKLAKQLMTYKPHSRIMPRVDAVKLWKELPQAIAEEYWVDGACIITFDWHFQFVAKGNRTVVRWVKHVTKEEHDQDMDFDPKKEDTDDCSDIDFQVIDEALASGVLDPEGPEHAHCMQLLGLVEASREEGTPQ